MSRGNINSLRHPLNWYLTDNPSAAGTKPSLKIECSLKTRRDKMKDDLKEKNDGKEDRGICDDQNGVIRSERKLELTRGQAECFAENEEYKMRTEFNSKKRKVGATKKV